MRQCARKRTAPKMQLQHLPLLTDIRKAQSWRGRSAS